ncbi:uncharacterized protein LOC100898330 [Galendromus occidentalis]|uniref:Uncharacterized protein LOC100898330 n=1 Tax=Galendromus occidentalis TaxID=34638 RepID=A0AAJ6QXC4_9ACAR|nr:uncharacterized protein LOC100898330 [Galendromus occidentalis]
MEISTMQLEVLNERLFVRVEVRPASSGRRHAEDDALRQHTTTGIVLLSPSVACVADNRIIVYPADNLGLVQATRPLKEGRWRPAGLSLADTERQVKQAQAAHPDDWLASL